MIRSVSILTIALSAITLAGCRKKATPAECDAMIDRYAALATQEALPDASADEIQIAQKRVRTEAADDEDFRACAGRVTQEELACAMKAQTPDAFEACIQ